MKKQFCLMVVNRMKKMKKVFGILLVIFSGLFCVTSCFCFFAAVTGKLEMATFGETVANAIFFAVFAVFSACVMKFGWHLWKGKKNSDLQKREIKLKPFLVEDRLPFAAYELERIYYEKLQNSTDVEQFYFVPNEAPVQLAIRKCQAYLECRKVHIRVSSEKSLEGCNNSHYEQCLKAGMHIVMYTGPYTLRDVTEGREYKVSVKTVNDDLQAGEIAGVWSLE